MGMSSTIRREVCVSTRMMDFLVDSEYAENREFALVEAFFPFWLVTEAVIISVEVFT